MLTRSNSNTFNASPSPIKNTPPTWQRNRELAKPEVPSTLVHNTKEYQTNVVSDTFKTMFEQPGREAQIETVVALVNKKHAFLRAGTGFGKSRIPEVYAGLHRDKPNYIVLTIVPLDSLGNNQIASKIQRGISAIHCNAENATKQNFDDIKNGVYQFVYMSPEVYLNNLLFRSVFFSNEFQRRLILTVIDEAHMVYEWGLVKSRAARHSAVHLQTQDRAVFCPSYGNLALRLTSSNVPVLLLSATCRPEAVESIMANLKWKEEDVVMVEGELVRDEIRLIRIPLEFPSKPGNDVQRFFSPKSIIDDSIIPRTLVYSNSQNETLDIHQAIHVARQDLNKRFSGSSSLIRRFHAVTGAKDKQDHIDAYGRGEVAIMACTMALGMGSDWPQTRRVITIGRMDPSVLGQMVGRAGRDGRPAASIMLVETRRSSGKNSLSEFVNPYKMTNDDRMDAFAITPVCLRIAFQVDNMIGHIPLSFDDPSYVKEKKRQEEKGMRPCLCSNCRPDLVASFLENQPHLTMNNFDSLVTACSILPSPVTNGWRTPNFKDERSENTNQTKIVTCASNEVIRKNTMLRSLITELLQDFNSLYQKRYPANNCYVRAHHMFNETHAWKIIKNYELLHSGVSLRNVFGSEPLKGTFRMIQDSLSKWATRGDFCVYLVDSQAQAASKSDSSKRESAQTDNLTPADPKRQKLSTASKKPKGRAPRGRPKKSQVVLSNQSSTVDRPIAQVLLSSVPQLSTPVLSNHNGRIFHTNNENDILSTQLQRTTEAQIPLLNHSQGVLMSLPMNISLNPCPPSQTPPQMSSNQQAHP